MQRDYVKRVRPGLLDWIESVRCKEAPWGRWKYHSKMVRPYALNASGLAIRLLHGLDELNRVPTYQLDEAIQYFQSCQDPDDGLFRDPLELEGDRTGTHEWEEIWGQRNGAALEALGILGAQPLWPVVGAQFANLREVDVCEWTMSLDWSNPWLHGESWARAIMAFLKTSTEATRQQDVGVLDRIFGTIESHLLDSRTGYPTRLGCQDSSVAMAGLFKIMFGFLSAGRRIPYAEQAIDSTLALQRANGEFGSESNMCLNWDSLWVMRELDLQLKGQHRHVEIVEAGNRLAEVLLSDYLKDDGGFAFHAVNAIPSHHGIRLCDGLYPIGDMLAAIMVLSCLQYCDEWSLGEAVTPRSVVPVLS